jgi:hypothetical protein
MSDEEFAADEVWFGDQFRLDESQGLVFVDEGSPGNGIPEDCAAVTQDQSPAETGECAVGNSIPTEFPTPLPTPLPMDTSPQQRTTTDVASKPKHKRNTISFAKQMILAKSDLFLSPLYNDKYYDATAEIVGQITGCPRESSGEMYRIHWKNPLPEEFQQEWLQIFIVSSEENKKRLRAAMAAYETSDGGARKKEASSSKKKVSSTMRRPSHNEMIVDESQVCNAPVAFVTTTTARAAALSVKTSSSISTLSQNSIRSPDPPRQPSTDRTDDLESLSDDGDDLDKEDNIYDIPFSDEESNEDEDSDEESVRVPSGP